MEQLELPLYVGFKIGDRVRFTNEAVENYNNWFDWDYFFGKDDIGIIVRSTEVDDSIFDYDTEECINLNYEWVLEKENTHRHTLYVRSEDIEMVWG